MAHKQTETEVEKIKRVAEEMQKGLEDFVSKLDQMYKDAALSIIQGRAYDAVMQFRTVTKPQLFFTNFWN